MIDSIISHSLQARSTSSLVTSRWLTVYLGNETITAQIALSRVSGSGTAKAQIFNYCYQSPLSFSTKEVCSPATLDLHNAVNLTANQSVVFVRHATQITFNLVVQDMFAAAIAMVFVHRQSIADLFGTVRMGP
jgi:hypothetical protein